MLVQPTHVVAPGGASGQPQHSFQVPATIAKLANLRDELATGEVDTVQAASRLTTLLATLSNPRTGTHLTDRYALPRWTFGGYCTNCLAYACQDPKCIDALTRHRWGICPDCKGSGYRDIDCGTRCDKCDCFFGAVEIDEPPTVTYEPAGTTPTGRTRFRRMAVAA